MQLCLEGFKSAQSSRVIADPLKKRWGSLCAMFMCRVDLGQNDEGTIYLWSMNI